MALPAKEFLSVSEAAKALGCTVGRIRQMLRKGNLKGQKLNERAWVVDPASLRKNAANPPTVGRPRIGA